LESLRIWHHLVLCLCVVDCVLCFSELHSLITTYTGIHGQTVAGIPEFSAVTTLDGRQIDYYDSDKGTLVPRQDWMKEFASRDTWKKDTKIREQVQKIYKNNIPHLMKRFDQTHGVHVYQRMYGCERDDETGDSRGFDQYGYDGEDFITLDLRKGRYNTSVPQATVTVEKWNNDRTQLDSLTEYYRNECSYWLRVFLKKSFVVKKGTLSLRTSICPDVTLLQKNSSSPVVCHATGFYPSAVTITWRKNGQDHNNVKIGDTLPNEDGTFQKNATLNVLQDVWKKDQYGCVVEHINLTDPIQKILTEDEIKSNNMNHLIMFSKFRYSMLHLSVALFTGYKKVRTFI
uniref:Major histocompatibility complex class I-related gene protein-like n=1 Tax=Sinocyclocheilus anshuiensis TaxID=1608454 RepID=A0A671SFQ2_9TELE